MNVLYLTIDLIFPSQVSQLIRAKQGTLRTIASPQSLVTTAAESRPDLIILDLNLPGLQPREIVDDLRRLETPPRVILAPAPPVHESKLAAAKNAGCDMVLTQGSFHRDISAILDRLSDS